MPERLNELTHWLRQDVGLPPFDIAPASSDASFRRYFRVRYAGQSRIVMDAPPDKEDCGPFIAIARAFHALGLNVPEVLEINLERGFLLLTDLGHSQYLNELNETSAPRLYRDAMQALLALQRPKAGSTILLPAYDRPLLMREMALFRDWFMEQHLGLALDKTITDTLDKAFDALAHSALEQPQVWVHRDYHSRNLMVTAQGNPGILDFQDAVTGPVTYDLASLLRDCYIAWPREQVEEWVENYHAQALKKGVISGVGAAQFLRWFDLMGVQRHLKAIGIFARLNIRDAKPGYLKDIPRTLGYVEEVSGRYPALAGLHALIHDHILPRMGKA
ncbi:MAG: phosphotransferase [Gammaproteobacteria bacterium]|jgi:aminoglycoside/choline kinase family phosphotransferase|nr:phosphotransferase [Gammaproteobacteria bacterium]